jgi:hypothetical protein
VSTAALSPSGQPGLSTKSGPISVFRIELACLLCGRAIGTLETRCWSLLGPALLRHAGQSRAVSIADWSRLRCATCGGNVYVDEIRTARLYPSGSWDDLERPRRGRPPKRLAAQRQVAALEGSGD